jgi:hypothetical protein
LVVIVVDVDGIIVVVVVDGIIVLVVVVVSYSMYNNGAFKNPAEDDRISKGGASNARNEFIDHCIVVVVI